MKRIYVCAGGGIRGIIPCCAMVEIERQTGEPARELFDYFAGTSTGALLVAALQAGIPAKDILKIYTDRAREIFTPGDPAATLKMLAKGYKYDSGNIFRVLKDEFGQSNGWTLNDCPRRILLTAVGVNGHVWYFTQDTPQNARKTGGLSLLDCATASAAAPTYFTPWYVNPLTGVLVGKCFDGGVACESNPVFQACIEAFRYDSFDPAGTRVYSFGTGYYPGVSSEPCGLLQTIEWSVDTLIDSAADAQARYTELVWPGIQRIFNAPLPRPIDMADTSAIPDLVKIGQGLASATDWVKILAG